MLGRKRMLREARGLLYGLNATLEDMTADNLVQVSFNRQVCDCLLLIVSAYVPQQSWGIVCAIILP